MRVDGVRVGLERGRVGALPKPRRRQEPRRNVDCHLCGLDLRIGLENILNVYWAGYFNAPRVVGEEI